MTETKRKNWNETFCCAHDLHSSNNMKWTNSSNRTGGTTLHATDGSGTSGTSTQNGGGHITNGNGTGAGDRRSIFYTNDVDSLKNGNNTKVRLSLSLSPPSTYLSISYCAMNTCGVWCDQRRRSFLILDEFFFLASRHLLSIGWNASYIQIGFSSSFLHPDRRTHTNSGNAGICHMHESIKKNNN